MVKQETIEVENVNIPGSKSNVNAVKYQAMKAAFIKILPSSPPGLTQKEIQQKVREYLPESVFPLGKTSAWWAKTV